mgnify:CR=1 FL=1
MVNLKQLQQAAVEALEDIKARDIQVYDVTGTSALFDRVIIATAESGRQLGALGPAGFFVLLAALTGAASLALLSLRLLLRRAEARHTAA